MLQFSDLQQGYGWMYPPGPGIPAPPPPNIGGNYPGPPPNIGGNYPGPPPSGPPPKSGGGGGGMMAPPQTPPPSNVQPFNYPNLKSMSVCLTYTICVANRCYFCLVQH